MKLDSTTTKSPLACSPGLRTAAAAMAVALGILMQPVSAATITDTAFVLQYNAGLNERNDVTIRPRTLASGNVLEISDTAGLSGCVRNPQNISSIHCDADQLVFFSMELDNKDDSVEVIESSLILSGYQFSANGGLGDDMLTGGSEQDEFFGDAGSDTLDGNNGPDALYGESGDDRLLGGGDHDHLSGGTGNDILYGEAGNDTIDGGSYGDSIHGGSGADTLRGGSGDDFIDADDGEIDVIDCGSGRDRVLADAADIVDRNCEVVLD
jgi:Ca2+-binding RTX toxin-like protein